jgi:two-component system OmpR family response regulator
VRIATVRGLGYCLEKFSEASAAAAAAAAANDARIAATAADK